MRLGVIRPPRLRTTETEGERSATWLELFYDLVFVVAVAALGQRLLADPGWKGALAFAGLFIPVWWAWAGYTFYADRYDTDDLGQRLLAVAQIIAIALMAVSLSTDVTGSSVAFALSYVGARTILILMYARARRHVAATRALVTGYMQGHSIAAAIWLISVFVPSPARFVLWGIGLAVDFATPFAVRRIQAKVPLDISHLPERFGLFTILVLGESIAAVVAGLSHEGWELRPTTAAVLGVLIASGLWWLYFDNVEGSVVRRRPEQRKAWKPTVWIYSHLPLAVGLVATGIGLEFIVADENHTAERWIVTGGMALALVAMGVIHLATEAGPQRRDDLKMQIRFVAAAVALLVGLVGGALSTTALAVILTLVAWSQVGVDVIIGERAARARPVRSS